MEFNEFQITLLQKAIIRFGIRTSQKYERQKFQKTLEILQNELNLLQQEKEFLMNEDKIRDVIRDTIEYELEDKTGRVFRPYGTEQDLKLDR